MAVIFIFFAIALGAAAAIFSNAHGQLYYGTSWAVSACETAPLFCGHPEYLAYAAGGCLVLGLGAALGGALSS
ncbi:hypothetical protein NML43_07410 [Rhodopseudomonas palustris]|uniref:hypothetical protein n=1 Tax=Rhodopseudomonas palustris TaxID=1076 RepID=UPI0020CEF54E|nr:hypothetical protein [Rhodopseudomonas palustris]MCP9626908.1 hypothetical protein [Rhodopseudomonas palustris]